MWKGRNRFSYQIFDISWMDLTPVSFYKEMHLQKSLIVLFSSEPAATNNSSSSMIQIDIEIYLLKNK